MQQETVIPIRGRLDMDSDDLTINKGDHSFAMNARFHKIMGAVLDTLGTSKAGTLSIPIGTYYVHGALDAGKYIFYAISNLTNAHYIIRYNIASTAHETVVNESYLGFSLGSWVQFQYNDNRDVLYWTDGRFGSFIGNVNNILGHNPPRQIVVSRAILYYSSGGTNPNGYSSMSIRHLDVIKHPALYPLECEYITDTSRKTNLIQKKMLQYSCQYVYENDERSTWSVWSRVALPTISESDEAFTSLTDYVISQHQNAVRVTYNSGNEQVKEIRFAVRDGNTGIPGLFKVVSKEKESLADDTEYAITYSGNESLVELSFDDFYNYDLVPITANSNILASNGSSGMNLIYGGIRQGFDGVNPDVSIDVRASRLYNGRPWDGGAINTYFDWREVVQRRALGGATTVLGFEELTEIPAEHCLFESFAFELDMTFAGGGVEYIFFTPSDLLEALGGSDTSTGCNNVFAFAVHDYLLGEGYTGMTLVGDTIQFNLVPGATAFVGKMHTYNPRRSSLKKGAEHVVAITYLDRAKRDRGVTVFEKVYVPFDKEIYDLGLYADNTTDVRTSLSIQIDHTPPDWAEYYVLSYQGNTMIEAFERRVVMGVAGSIVDGRHQFVLDDWYSSGLDSDSSFSANLIESGDIVRIVRGPQDLSSPYTQSEFFDYKEYVIEEVNNLESGPVALRVNLGGDVGEYITSGSAVNLGTNSGVLIEIIKRKKTNDDSPYFSMGKVYPILNPHTVSRVHGGESVENIPCEIVKGTSNYVDVYGDYGWLTGGLGAGVTATVSGSSGNNGTYTINSISVSHSDSIPTTRLFLSAGMTVDDGLGNNARVALSCDQTGSNPAIVHMDHGDVYCRQIIQRFRVTFPSVSTPIDRDLERIEKPFWVESFHYTDKYLSDSYDIGQPYAELDDLEGFEYRRELLRNSLKYIQGTNVNGLSTFLSPNQASVSDKEGPIVRLIQVGFTLKVFQHDKVSSIYLGRSELAQADQNNQLVTIDRVLGSIRPHEEPFGTSHPYGIVQVDRDLFYIDQKRKVVVICTPGGQFVISGEGSGVQTFFDGLYEGTSSSFSIVGGHDRRNSEVVFSVTRKGFGDDSFTIAYNYDKKWWTTFFGYQTDLYVNSNDDRLFCFDEHILYELNTGPVRYYFTEYSDFELDLVMNENSAIKKVFDTHEVRSSEILLINPITIPADAENASGMTTIMNINVQEIIEGTVFGAYMKDRNTPGYPAGSGDLAMYEGRDMRGLSIKHKYVRSGAKANQAKINHVVVRWTPSEPV